MPVTTNAGGAVDEGATRDTIAEYEALGVTVASVGLGRNLADGRDVDAFVRFSAARSISAVQSSSGAARVG